MRACAGRGCGRLQVVVHGLPWSYDTPQLMDLMKAAGHVLEAEVMRERETGRSKGWGTVLFATPDAAQAAINVSGSVHRPTRQAGRRASPRTHLATLKVACTALRCWLTRVRVWAPSCPPQRMCSPQRSVLAMLSDLRLTPSTRCLACTCLAPQKYNNSQLHDRTIYAKLDTHLR